MSGNKTIEQVPTMNSCPHCHCDQLVKHNGNYVCSNCGVVLQQVVVTNDYSRISETDRSKITIADKGLGSIVQPNRNNLSSKRFKSFRRMQRIIYHSYQNETIYRHFKTIYRFASDYQIPKNARERILFLFRKIYTAQKNGEITKITNNNCTVFFGCLVAIREYHLPISFRELEQYFKQRHKRISVVAIRTITLDAKDKLGITIPTSSSLSYLPLFLQRILATDSLQKRLVTYQIVPEQFEQEMLQICCTLNDLVTKEKGGVAPNGLAASLLYVSCIVYRKRHNIASYLISQREIACVTDICEYTVRTHYGNFLKKAMKKMLGEEPK